MNQSPYPYSRELDTRYIFVSEGKRSITKVVEFFVTSEEHLYGLGFGDLQDDGTVDDAAISNNGDSLRVISTVIHIVHDFTKELPGATVYFTGNTTIRTRLYNRIIKSNFLALRNKFEILAVREAENEFIEEPYHPASDYDYEAFILKTLITICGKENNW